MHIYIYIYIYIVTTNFTMVLCKPLVPRVYVLLYFGLFVYRDCMFYVTVLLFIVANQFQE